MIEPKPAPLREPDVSRMEQLERALAEEMARSAALLAAIDAARAPWEAAWERLNRYDLDVNPDPARWRQLQADVERAWADVMVAQDAWRTAVEPEHEHRVEWLQLQVVRGFLPPCVLCGRTVGPAYLVLGRDEHPPALCLACLDSWACDYDPDAGRRPPSHWVELVAREARERETARRQQPSALAPLRVLGRHEIAPERSPARPCWHCGETVEDLGGREHLYVGRDDHEPPMVVLEVAALVPEGTQPEIGEVCLLCLDHDLELHERWPTIERDLCDPVRLRHERALRHFVEHGR
jgi:hypothetical protein